jgi:hypothetical protein
MEHMAQSSVTTVVYDTGRVSSLMSNKWTNQKNQSSLELITRKSELKAAINYDDSYKELRNLHKKIKKMLSSAAAMNRYM